MNNLLIFDLDGTLLWSHHHICSAVQDTFREFELAAADEAEVLAHLGEPSELFCRNLAPEVSDPGRFRSRFRANERRALSQKGTLYEGVVPLLERLAGDGFELAICSNASMEYIELALNTTGIKRLFSAVISASEYPSKADAIEPLLRKKPRGHAALIGDTHMDASAAALSRIPFIAARYGYGSGPAMDTAPFFAEAPEDILASARRISLYTELFDRIRSKPGVRCVGVNGVDTSGKSTFAKRFAAYLHSVGQAAAIVHLDDFHNPKALRTRGNNEIDAYIQNAFDLKTLVNELLAPVRQNKAVHKTLALLDLDSDEYTAKRRYDFDSDTLVILEGVLLYREPLLELIDYRIFLEIGFNEALRRAAKRDVPRYGEQMLARYKAKYIPIQRRYLRECRPREISDCVVNNTDVARPVIVG